MVDVDPALYPVLDQIVPQGSATLNFIDYTARRTVASRDLLGKIPAAKVESSLILTLADDNVGVLPQSSHSALHELVQDLKRYGWAGFSTRYWMPGDLDFVAYYLSRASFVSGLTPQQALADLITQGLAGKSHVLLQVTAFARLGAAQEVYPSQELILDKGNSKKSKTLYHVQGVAGIHSQKLGNALRTIDTWHPDVAELG
ncbi:MAG: type I-F CRISPR-associated protein Cas7f/Csy3, partial [Planctomycetaceae bacterium]